MIECWKSVGHGQHNWLHECVNVNVNANANANASVNANVGVSICVNERVFIVIRRKKSVGSDAER